jgi:hypothetical protein
MAMLFMLLHCAVQVFIFPGTAAQAAVACMLAVVSMVVEAKLDPLLDSADAMLYMTGCIIIFLSMFMSLLIRGETYCDPTIHTVTQYVKCTLVVAYC